MARVASVLIALAALAAVAFWSQRSKAQAAVDAPPTVAGAPSANSGAAASVSLANAIAVPAASAPKADRSHQLELPDGTFVAALNGATDPAPLKQYWGSQVPWSPIVGVERNDQGVDWYRHANGSYSTTQMVWRSDLKAYAPMTRVGHQGPAVTPAVGK